MATRLIWVEYALQKSEGTTFENPAPIEFDRLGFRFRLENDVLHATALDEFVTLEEARAAIEPFLEAWSASNLLSRGGERDCWFTFKGHEQVDVSNPHVLHGSASLACSFSVMSAAPHVTRRTYPAPPENFDYVDPQISRLLLRVQAWREGREILSSVAYLCISTLSLMCGGWDKMKEHLGISRDVVRTYTELATNKGGLEARKGSGFMGQDYTTMETNWLATTMTEILRRMLVYKSSHTPIEPKLTLNDLPPLT